MQLFFTDIDFVKLAVSRPNIPFLCDTEMRLVREPNAYLQYIATIRGRTRSPKTWRTYGCHLYEYFSFIETNQLQWHSMTMGTLAAWRDSMISRGCARSTVNQRLRCISKFYLWAVRSKLIESSPFGTENLRIDKHSGVLTHVDSTGNQFQANLLTAQTYQAAPKFLLLSIAIQFVESLRPKMLRLMGYLALLTGMRREEITCLNYKVFPNPCGHDPNKQISMVLDDKLTPTKGNKTRTVMVPYDLAVAIWHFFCEEWPKRNAAHLKRNGRESSNLFLSECGDELSLMYLNNSFAKASKESGIKCHPHMLRHTYGTYEFIRMSSKLGRDRSLLWLRERMGHSSISTTEIYIHASELIKNSDVDDYQLEILGAMIHGDQKTSFAPHAQSNNN